MRTSRDQIQNDRYVHDGYCPRQDQLDSNGQATFVCFRIVASGINICKKIYTEKIWIQCKKRRKAHTKKKCCAMIMIN